MRLLLNVFLVVWIAALAVAAQAAPVDLRTQIAELKAVQNKKLDSALNRLLLNTKAQLPMTKESAGEINRSSGGRLKVNSTGAVQVYAWIRNDFSLALAETGLQALGFRKELVNDQLRIIQGWLPIRNLDAASELAFVKRITIPSYARRRTGSINTEGDAVLKADQLRAQGLTGRGAKVGVISDGTSNISAAQATGDVPAAVFQIPGSGDEGTAMLEIIHDLAPEAELGFCGVASSLEFINCVEQLRATFQANVIVDDLGFPAEPYFQDGPVAQSVNAAVAAGVIFVSAAGNDGLNWYEANYRPSSATVNSSLPYDPPHDFGLAVGRGADHTLSYLVAPGDEVAIFLQWNEPFGQAAKDYDLLVFAQGQLQDQDISIQDGDDDPLQIAGFFNGSGAPVQVDFVVALYEPSNDPQPRATRFKLLATNRFANQQYITPGSIYGHPAALGALAVGAVMPNNTASIQPYSSTGFTRIDFPGAHQRVKPDVVAADCTRVTGVGGFGEPHPEGGATFCGTSAAAPHVAGVAALLKSGFTGDIAQAIRKSALDLGASGVDNVFGAGLVDALAAVQFSNEPSAGLPGVLPIGAIAAETLPECMVAGEAFTNRCSGGSAGCDLGDTASAAVDPLLPALSVIASVLIWRRRKSLRTRG